MYTKGEWRYCQANKKDGCSCGLIWSLEQDAVVAIAIDEDETGSRPHSQMVANAHLIAESPRMAEWIAKVAKQDFVVFPEDKTTAVSILAEVDKC